MSRGRASDAGDGAIDRALLRTALRLAAIGKLLSSRIQGALHAAQQHLVRYEDEHGTHPVIVLDDAEGATKTFSYDPASRWIPTLVKGTVISERALTEPGPVVAIAVDGIIRATVRAHAVEEGRWRFEVLVPEEAVSAGSLLTVQLVSDLPVTADAG